MNNRESKKTTQYVSSPVFPLLAMILAIAKLAGWIDISWWLVTMPLWFPPLVILGILAIAFPIIFIYYVIEDNIK